MTDPLILAFDTSGAHCAAALLRGKTVLETCGEEMARGQAERLMGLLGDIMARHGTGWHDLSAVAVGTGPGNFTGIRIGVSAARGVALGLGIPAYGVTGFAARAQVAPPGTQVAIPAPRGMAYILQPSGPITVPLNAVANPAPEPNPATLATAIAQHARTVWPEPAKAPAPLYIKPPDAAPAKDVAPPLLS